MRVRLRLMLAALGALASKASHADDAAWRFEPKTAGDAARVQSTLVYPTNTFEARLSYRNLDAGGSMVTVMLTARVPIPYVIVPGVRMSNTFSVLRVELPMVTAKLPMMPRVTGLSDLHVIDAAIRHWERVAVGFGVTMLVPTATHELLGTGQLAMGAIAGVNLAVGDERQATISVTAENLTSVAGEDGRPEINTLIARPMAVYYLPHATYVDVDPEIRFDWKKDGDATLLLRGGVGLALSKHVVLKLEAAWIAAGVGNNDVSLGVLASYVGW